MRKIIEIDEDKCNGCGHCVTGCDEGALAIIDGKAKIVKDRFCDGLGACIGECPEDALKLIEREADAFDEAAVHVHLETLARQAASAPAAAGCAGAQIRTLPPRAETAEAVPAQVSALTNWPVQIHLIPPHAPFLKAANLLIAADCVPVSFPDLHRTYLKNRTVMIGCPKFDDGKAYIQKFAEIFATAGIRSVTVLSMEVPCCAGLIRMVQTGMERAGVTVPMEEIVVTIQGQIQEAGRQPKRMLL